MAKYLKEADENNSILTKKYVEMDFEFKKLSYKHKEYILELLEKMGIKFQ